MEANEHSGKEGRRWWILPSYAGSSPDKTDVPACPECKSTKFVAAMVNEVDGTTECVCCENGHAWHPDELLRLHILEVWRVENYTGMAMGHALNVWIQEFAAEAEGSTDRAAAILSGAMLDEVLVILLSALAIDEKLLMEHLLQPSRPLGGFGPRIDVCYLFGLISIREWHALRLAKGIRNDFAHKLDNLSFNDNRVRDHARSIFQALQIKAPDEEDGRKVFDAAIEALLASLVAKIGYVRRVARMPHDPSSEMTMHYISRTSHTASNPSTPPAA